MTRKPLSSASPIGAAVGSTTTRSGRPSRASGESGKSVSIPNLERTDLRAPLLAKTPRPARHLDTCSASNALLGSRSGAGPRR